MRKTKKGFTLVELLVVIAILAILATVCVVGYISFIDKAKESNDMALVKQLNTILQANEIHEGKNQSITDVIADLSNNGIELESVKLSVKGRKIQWDEHSDRFIIVDDDKKLIYAAEGYDAEKANLTTVPTSYTTLNSSNTSSVTITEDTVINLSNDVSFDENSNLVIDGATVVITGNGKISQTVISKLELIQVKNGGHLIVNGGEIRKASKYGESNHLYYTSCIQVCEGSSLVVNSGKIVNELPNGTTDDYTGPAIHLKSNSKSVINGGYISSATSNTICGNGNDINTYLEINGGDIVSETDIAIYHPQSGMLIINGGKITGNTCIYIKSGILSVSGGTFEATGTPTNATYNGNGGNPTGDCIVIDSCGYPNGKPSAFVINSEKMTCKEGAEKVAAYVLESKKAEAPDVYLNGTKIDATVYSK